MRHANAPFTGLRLPFGCLIDFKPSPVKGKTDAKFAPTSVPGLFVGYNLQPGGRFKGDYLVISLADAKRLLEKPKSARIFVQRVKEIYINPDEGYVFPMKEDYDRKRRSLNGTIVLDEIENKSPSVAETAVEANEGDVEPPNGEAASSSTSPEDFDLEARGLLTWERRDINVKKYTTTDKDGPNWKLAVRRVTIDDDTQLSKTSRLLMMYR